MRSMMRLSWSRLDRQDPGRQDLSRQWSGRRVWPLAAVLVLGCVTGSAHAQGKLDARYVASLGGVPIGKGAWVIEIGDDQYTAAASGMTTGLLRVFATGQGSGASRGVIRGDNLMPTTYASSINNDKRVEELRIVLSSGTVKEYSADPPTVFNPDRIPLTDAHRRGVVDPMSATLVRVPGTADPVAPEACRRTVPVFDGRMRFDLHMSFKRIEKVHAEKGYEGPVVVCGVQFTPVAGHVPDRAAIKYLVAQRDIEVWLAPISGTRVLVPFRVSVPTPLGTGVLEATQFVSVATPAPPRPTPASANAR
jgi:hypothetical protein